MQSRERARSAGRVRIEPYVQRLGPHNGPPAEFRTRYLKRFRAAIPLIKWPAELAALNTSKQSKHVPEHLQRVEAVMLPLHLARDIWLRIIGRVGFVDLVPNLNIGHDLQRLLRNAKDHVA